MYCDALTLAAVVQELRDKLLGGTALPRVQQVLLLHRLAIGLEAKSLLKRGEVPTNSVTIS